MRTNKVHLALVLGAAIALTLVYKRPEGFMNAGHIAEAFTDASAISKPYIENAPAPAGAGMTQTLTPVNLEANYEELKRRLDNYERELPQTIGQRIADLTPTIVRGVMDKKVYYS